MITITIKTYDEEYALDAWESDIRHRIQEGDTEGTTENGTKWSIKHS